MSLGVAEVEGCPNITGSIYRHEGQSEVVAAGLGGDGDVEGQEGEVEETVLTQSLRVLGGEAVLDTETIQNIREGKRLIFWAGVEKAVKVRKNKFTDGREGNICSGDIEGKQEQLLGSFEYQR